MGDWRNMERGGMHDADGDLSCPVEGCNAAGPGLIEMTGGEGPSRHSFECYRGHGWDVEEPGPDENPDLLRVFVRAG